MADSSVKKLIDLAKIEGNKFFVLDANGEPVLVMMSVDEYEKLLARKLENQVAEIENINREILEAQKRDTAAGIAESAASAAEDRQRFQDQLKSEVIDSTFSFENNNDQI